MGYIGEAELAAAVSEAGGLGVIGRDAGLRARSSDPQVVGEMLRTQVRRARALTRKPLAVNLAVGRGGPQASDRRAEVALEEGVKVALVSAGPPDVYTRKLKGAGLQVIHAISTVAHARRAEAEGVDAVIAEGFEGGGHSGGECLPVFVLVPQVADAVKIPVIAAGGIADVRQLVAAFALGAEAVYMGTRFMATVECPIHPRFKEALVRAGDAETVAYSHGQGRGTMRVLKNSYAHRLLAQGQSYEPVQDVKASDPAAQEVDRILRALIEGEVEEGLMPSGAGVGLIRDIATAAQVVERLAQGYRQVLEVLESQLEAFSQPQAGQHTR